MHFWLFDVIMFMLYRHVVSRVSTEHCAKNYNIYCVSKKTDRYATINMT